MRILHTSDWHLGKNLEGFSRMDEQERFIEDFINIVDKNNIDMVIIAGDIYDNGNPPARAEKMFYDCIKKVSNKGERLVLIIAGNHDNPERLVAASSLAYDEGIILMGTPKTIVPKGKYGNFKVINSDLGCLEIEVKEEKAVIISLPYPSEKRLNEILSKEMDNDEDRRKTYSERIGDIFSNLQEKYYKDNTVNLAISHIFVNGSEETDSERPIQLGGSLAVDVDKLPKKAQYIGLGHLHKPQKVRGIDNAYYSGSPLPYSKSERGYSKGCKIIEAHPGKKAIIEEVYFNNYKPIEVWHCNGIKEAINKCEENKEKDMWLYLHIKTKEYISTEDIKALKEIKKDIVEIVPEIEEKREETFNENIKEKSMAELFKSFYLNQRGIEASEELMDLFLSIAQEEDEYETEETCD
ncbi:exonuclease SbcCD subunit D [Clostridium botulinum]|uniref:exonuclease SbcCD subunit D n=1 Tax=Clostridium botulinum TaxID=1491 RepID=UPI0007E10036|nr:exonuclease SbcCD subunit D [Clostridium botulinum]KEJ01644.1 exonuclease [Clostridium botulinum F 357]MBE1304811.1 exonuclease SbcCD subunit D [Clostridium botulinum]